MRYRVVFDPAADADLTELYDYIAPKAGRAIARRYINQLVGHCAALKPSPPAARDMTSSAPVSVLSASSGKPASSFASMQTS
ncbi:type II toxin-antitoxin system RelE/ParE family toxin [Neorhizobium tunisiense]|uniref:type II toxin-antitoxin system RelE/ParE family toxin n=1 Tax=Neorhizobium tunisiense TaxID=3144793 RepID=UPI004048E0D1